MTVGVTWLWGWLGFGTLAGVFFGEVGGPWGKWSE